MTFIYIPRSYKVKLNVLALKLKSREKWANYRLTLSLISLKCIINTNHTVSAIVYMRECVQHVYLLHFSLKPSLTEIQHYNIINIIIGICFPFNYIISTVKSWLSVVIYFDICVCVCVLMDNTVLCILEIN